MKCFTVWNDLVPFDGISANKSLTAVGIFGNFCSVADGQNQGPRPNMVPKTSVLGQGLRLPSFSSTGPIIVEAGVIPLMMGQNYPVLTAPDKSGKPAVLVYWAVNQNTNFGLVKSHSCNSKATLYYYTTSHEPYYEALASLTEKGAISLLFGTDRTLTLVYQNRLLALDRSLL